MSKNSRKYAFAQLELLSLMQGEIDKTAERVDELLQKIDSHSSHSDLARLQIDKLCGLLEVQATRTLKVYAEFKIVKDNIKV